MTYADWTNAALEAELKKRGLKSSGNKDEMAGRLELDDAERDIDLGVGADPETEFEPEPEPELPPAAVAPPPRVKPRPRPKSPEPRPGQPYLPATHRRENQDVDVRYTVLPDGRLLPWDD